MQLLVGMLILANETAAYAMINPAEPCAGETPAASLSGLLLPASPVTQMQVCQLLLASMLLHMSSRP
jgi:hypothetical protein